MDSTPHDEVLGSRGSLIIIPTYNERQNLAELFRRVRESAPDAHILIVDDGSPDGTADFAESLFQGFDGGFVLRRKGPRGLGLSYVDGYARALAEGYTRVVQMDADLSHDPAYIPDLVRSSQSADLVVGSRYVPGGGVEDWPFHRLFLSKFANAYVSAITGLAVKDSTSGFRCYTRRALEAMRVHEVRSNGYAFQVEMTARASEAGLRIVESPIVFTDRLHGKSKISRKVLLESMIMPWRMRRKHRRQWQLEPTEAVVEP